MGRSGVGRRRRPTWAPPKPVHIIHRSGKANANLSFHPAGRRVSDLVDSETKLAILWDERAITNTMLRFGRSLDLGDWEACRSCLSDQLEVDFERLTGFPPVHAPAEALTDFGECILSPMRRHHVYSNFSIRLDGDSATAIVYMTARHWKATDLGASDYNQYGWYEVGFARTGEDWHITRLKHDFQWVDGNNALFEMNDPKVVAAIGRLFTPASA